MPSVLWKQRGRLWIAGSQSILLKCQAYFRCLRLVYGRGEAGPRPGSDQFVTEVADDLCATMEIWVVEDGFQTKAYIASCHRLIETYRGYLLCSNTPGHTFLIDMRTYTYIRGSAAHLLQIDGVDQAKRFVDELCRRL